MKRLLFIAFVLFSNALIAQSWDKFTYFSNSEKYFYDIDEQSMIVRNDILSGWIRIREKTELNIFIDKLYFHCQTFQYSISTRRTVDKDGKLLKILYDNEISTLKWNETNENSIGRKLGIKYCKRSPNNSSVDKPNSSDWLSLGKSETGDFTYYIDPSKNKKINNELYYQAKIEYHTDKKLPGSNKEFSIIIQDSVINCNDVSFAIIKYEYFNRLNLLQDSTTISKEFAKFNSTTPTSYAGRIAEKYCEQKSLPSQSDSRNPNANFNKTEQISKDALLAEISEKCIKLGYKKGSPPHDRCIKQLID